MKALLYIETHDGTPLASSLELVSAATSLGAEATAVSVEKVEGLLLEDVVTEALTRKAKEEKAEVVLLSATALGKLVTPRLAVRLQGGAVNDAVALKLSGDEIEVTRPVYGGCAFQTLKSAGGPLVVSVRAGSFPAPETLPEVKKAGGAEALSEAEKLAEAEDLSEADQIAEATVGKVIGVQEVQPVVDKIMGAPDKKGLAKVLEFIEEAGTAVNLEAAKVIVSGGRGMGSAEDFALCGQLAELLGGVVGATRPAIEAGWIPRTHQVGQSGKIVTPDLYIACGISGSTQHISGMVGSKYIVAINKDADAPIFSVADVGIVGDVKQILPLLIAAVKERKQL